MELFFANFNKSINLKFYYKIVIYRIATKLETNSNVQKESNTLEEIKGKERVKWK